MSYEEWEATQKISPSSPEAYYAELAWKAAIQEATKRILELLGDAEG